MLHETGITLVFAITFGAGCSHPAGEQRTGPGADPPELDQQYHAPSVISEEELREQPITFELDIPYAASENRRQRLDLYLPKTRSVEKLPVIVFFHGGGWLAGDKADGAAHLLPFLRTRNYAAISVGYRRSGEATWPAQLHDSKAAIRWIRANAKHYGIDPDRIAVWGWSTGAHLALMLGVTGDVQELEGEVGPHTGVTSEVAGVVNFFAADNPEMAVAASPITYVSSNDPPVLTLHGTQDDVVPYDHAVRLHEALTVVGVPSYFITVEGAEHGEVPDEAEERVGAFLANILLGRDVEIPTGALRAPTRE